MENIISEYKTWKQQGAAIRNQARQAMESKFHELLTEAVAIAQEYQEDFGTPLKPPVSVTAFKFVKAAPGKGKPGTKKAGSKPAAAAGHVAQQSPASKQAPQPEPSPAIPSAKLNALNKKLAAAKKKLADAKTAGAPTRNLEDKIYEIEDEIRLATAQEA